MDSLHEGLCTFMIIPRSLPLRMANISDKICSENQNTYFIFNNFFPKIVLFMRKYGKNVTARLVTDNNNIRRMRTSC